MAMTYEGPVQSLSSHEQELQHLRAQVEAKERQLAGLAQSKPREEVVKERIIHHLNAPIETTHAPEFRMSSIEARQLALELDPESDDETMNELRSIMETRGIRNAFSVLQTLKSPHLEDDFHRFLVAYVMAGMKVKGLNEGEPEWKSLHLTFPNLKLIQIKMSDTNTLERWSPPWSLSIRA